MENPVTRFIKDQTAVSSIEYALLASLIAMVVVGNIGALGSALNAMYTMVQETVAAALTL